jgi:hypothetical protein
MQEIEMAKTITVRLEDSVYEIFKKAADGHIEYATLNFTVNETVVDDVEMNEILAFEKDIKKGLADISSGKYKVIG